MTAVTVPTKPATLRHVEVEGQLSVRTVGPSGLVVWASRRRGNAQAPGGPIRIPIKRRDYGGALAVSNCK